MVQQFVPQLWTGTSTFSTGQTPFGFYDADPQFAADADRVANMVARHLGYPNVSVELPSGSMYAAFERAVTDYSSEINKYKTIDNYLYLEGTPTNQPKDSVVIKPSLAYTIRIAEQYANLYGVGGSLPLYSGSLSVKANRQVYDLNAWAAASASLSPGDSIEIRRVYHGPIPAASQYMDPWAGGGAAWPTLMQTYGMGSFSPSVSYILMPVSFDIQRIQQIEMANTVRASQYSFDLNNNVIRLKPAPKQDYNLYFDYVKQSDLYSSIVDLPTTGSVVTDSSKVPYGNLAYSTINAQGRSWIFRYTLALCKEALGLIRGKYQQIEAPNAPIQLNYSDLITSAQEEQQSLLQDLRDTLDRLTKQAQMEKESQQREYLRQIQSGIPLKIYIG